eukprot:4611695-Alexandrium_andersonii.AAC.1
MERSLGWLKVLWWSVVGGLALPNTSVPLRRRSNDGAVADGAKVEAPSPRMYTRQPPDAPSTRG